MFKKVAAFVTGTIVSNDILTQLRQNDASLTSLISSRIRTTKEGLTDKDIKILCEALAGNTKVDTIEFEGGYGEDKISDIGAEYIAQLLEHNTTLIKIDLSRNNISDKGAKLIAQSISKNKKSRLEVINLSNNKIINDGGAAEIVRVLINNYSGARVFLSKNQVSDDGSKAIAQVLKEINFYISPHYSYISPYIDLSENKIGGEGTAAIAHVVLKKAIEKNKIFARVVLRDNPVGDKGAKLLAEVYKELLPLVQEPMRLHLGFSNHNISSEGVKEITNVLGQTSKLFEIDLSCNKIGPEAAPAIAQLLKNSAIYSFSIDRNKIGFAGAQVIARFLEQNHTMRSISIYDCDLGSAGNEIIIKSLVNNTEIFYVSLDSASDGEGQAIVEMLQKNTRIIDFRYNHNLNDKYRLLIKALLERNLKLVCDGYDLVLMSDMPAQKEKNKLYIKVVNRKIQYITADMKEINTITARDLGKGDDFYISNILSGLSALKNDILSFTSKRGETVSDLKIATSLSNSDNNVISLKVAEGSSSNIVTSNTFNQVTKGHTTVTPPMTSQEIAKASSITIDPTASQELDKNSTIVTSKTSLQVAKESPIVTPNTLQADVDNQNVLLSGAFNLIYSIGSGAFGVATSMASSLLSYGAANNNPPIATVPSVVKNNNEPIATVPSVVNNNNNGPAIPAETIAQLTGMGVSISENMTLLSMLKTKQDSLSQTIAAWESQTERNNIIQAELEAIAQDPEVKWYYQMMKSILERALMAAIVIASGKVSSSTSLAGMVFDGLCTLAGISFPTAVPALGFIKVAASTLDSTITYREMQQHLRWVELAEIPEFAGMLARRLAMAQKTQIIAGISSTERSTWEKIKDKCNLLAEELKSGKDLSDGEKRAMLDAKELFSYMLSHDKPDDMTLSGRINLLLQQILGNQYVYTPLKITNNAQQTNCSATSVTASTITPMVVSSEDVTNQELEQFRHEIVTLKAAQAADQQSKHEQAQQIQALNKKLELLNSQIALPVSSHTRDNRDGTVSVNQQVQMINTTQGPMPLSALISSIQIQIAELEGGLSTTAQVVVLLQEEQKNSIRDNNGTLNRQIQKGFPQGGNINYQQMK